VTLEMNLIVEETIGGFTTKSGNHVLKTAPRLSQILNTTSMRHFIIFLALLRITASMATQKIQESL
jgi:hypothetical protein